MLLSTIYTWFSLSCAISLKSLEHYGIFDDLLITFEKLKRPQVIFKNFRNLCFTFDNLRKTLVDFRTIFGNIRVISLLTNKNKRKRIQYFSLYVLRIVTNYLQLICFTNDEHRFCILR